MTTIQELFDEKLRFPSPPAVALKILEAVRGNDNSFEDIAQIINADPSLALRVLKIANSSLYGLKKSVSSLAQATGLIGTDAIKNIALSFVIVGEFQHKTQGSFSLDLFWRRSLTTAVAAEIIGKTVGHRDQDLFVSGLLQDMGVLLFFLSLPEDYTTVLDNKRVNGLGLCHEEREKFGCDHTEIALHLFTAWNIPDSIKLPIRYSHTPGEADETFQNSARILKIADQVGAIYHGLRSSSKSMIVHADLSKHWGLESEQVDELIDTIGDRSTEVLKIFNLDPKEMKPFSQIIQEANEALGELNLSYEQLVFDLKQAQQNSEQLARELQQANENLKKLAYRDSLTGLYNRRFFFKVFSSELERAIRYRLPLSLLLLDLDFFKTVNDTHGHQAGDEVLKRIGDIISSLIRTTDLGVRYGGEEFALLLPETAPNKAIVLAQRLRRAVEKEVFDCGETQISVTISIGLSGSDKVADAMTADGFIEKGDQALYRAKENGRNRIEVETL